MEVSFLIVDIVTSCIVVRGGVRAVFAIFVVFAVFAVFAVILMGIEGLRRWMGISFTLGTPRCLQCFGRPAVKNHARSKDPVNPKDNVTEQVWMVQMIM
jgi:hypothetical protein